LNTAMLLLTAVLTLATVVVAWATVKYVRVVYAPVVSAFFETDQTWVYLVIQNTGTQPPRAALHCSRRLGIPVRHWISRSAAADPASLAVLELCPTRSEAEAVHVQDQLSHAVEEERKCVDSLRPADVRDV
jgi:hypothetical protein